MSRILEEIVRKLDPTHDFDGVRFRNEMSSNFQEEISALLINLYSTYVVPLKNVFRGAVVGGIFGYFTSVVSGYPPEKGLMIGAAGGAVLDLAQYLFRASYHYLKAQFTPQKQ